MTEIEYYLCPHCKTEFKSLSLDPLRELQDHVERCPHRPVAMKRA